MSVLVTCMSISTVYFISNPRIRTIMQCSPEVNEMQHGRGEVQQITHNFKIVNLLLLRQLPGHPVVSQWLGIFKEGNKEYNQMV